MQILNVEVALNYMAGNRELLLRLLGSFIEKYSATASEVANLLADGKRIEASKIAHSVKGAAGNLGGEILQAKSAGLQHLLEDAAASAEQVASAHGEFADAIAQFIQAATAYRSR